ncbi:winged helix-turn-helix domain-containing protein [Nonomuraea dietziae]|uniref:winged helix-turn-helix domain-containing protein n=1 Tax=Nonomuraea dietziae TaxID=65515 RepID=UPI0031D5B8D5
MLRQLAEPRTCTEVGGRLGQTAQRVYYHVKKLVEAGPWSSRCPSAGCGASARASTRLVPAPTGSLRGWSGASGCAGRRTSCRSATSST